MFHVKQKGEEMEIFYYLIGFIMGAVFMFLLNRNIEGEEYEYDTPEEEKASLQHCVAIVLTVVIVLGLIAALGVII